MQEVSRREFWEIAVKANEDFAAKVKVNQEEDLPTPAKKEEAEEDGGDEEEEEFSFVIASADGSPFSADDIFEDGRIRPVFPFFDRELLFSGEDSAGVSGSGAPLPPLKKVFVEEREEEVEGPYCVWGGNAPRPQPPSVVEALPGGGACKKSNSTGFSKLWRFREFVLRSNSDGKDAFVFLHHHHNNNNNNNNNKEEKKGKGKETASLQVYYARNKAAKEGDKRRSYLPYRKDLVGFFANVNGLSRNVHPF